MTNKVRPIINKTATAKCQSDKTSTLLNPMSELFDFELWAKEVGQQMQAALQSRSSQSQLNIFKM